MLRDIHSLWIGERLGPLEELCLCSFVKQGHKVFLHSYKKFDLPNGVIAIDANELIPEDQIIRYKRNRSVALFANRYRYEILRNYDVYWADADIFCMRPFDFEEPYVFGIDTIVEGRPVINNCVLRAPYDSELLRNLLEPFNKPRSALRFLSTKQKIKSISTHIKSFKRLSLECLPWGTTGPIALTYLANDLGLMQYALPKNAFAELKKLRLFEENFNWIDTVNNNATYAAHFTQSKLGSKPVDLTKPLPGSFYEYCVKEVGSMTNYF
ncbi:MAG: hypothetical protein P8Y67_09525 [Alphaproteobacteria bacterium]